MDAKQKAEELIKQFSKYAHLDDGASNNDFNSINCDLIAVENEYNALREQLFNIRACGIIIGEKVYLARLQQLIDEEKEVKQELEKL